MPLQCNIDARGKAIRMVYGVALIVIGLVLLIFWAWRTGSILAWIIAVGCIVSGGFATFEARAGWCVLRAMGMKTRF